MSKFIKYTLLPLFPLYLPKNHSNEKVNAPANKWTAAPKPASISPNAVAIA